LAIGAIAHLDGAGFDDGGPGGLGDDKQLISAGFSRF
jgi:hypothetical protein